MNRQRPSSRPTALLEALPCLLPRAPRESRKGPALGLERMTREGGCSNLLGIKVAVAYPKGPTRVAASLSTR